MGYTLLKATGSGIVLAAYHARRFSSTPEERAAWCRTAATLSPGIWAVRTTPAGEVLAEGREGSRLREGLAVRLIVSPAVGLRGAFPKPAPPCLYDSVRLSGVASLLTSGDGTEILEACVAAVVAWDGRRLVCVPEDRPRVWSTAEAAVRDHLSPRIAPILAASDWPILLLNAVKGGCGVAAVGRREFPSEQRAAIEALFARLTAEV